VTAVSQYTTRQTMSVFGRNDIVAIPNWIDTECFKPDDRQIPNQPFQLLFVGNLNRRKGFDLLPAIMRQLGGDFEFRYTGVTQELGNSADLPSNMKALGRLTTIATLVKAYQSCDALLFPTRLEGFGLVALEAQACGRPVITTGCSSLPEVVEHGNTGILCPTDDIDAFVMAAKKLREDPCHWRQMCVNAVKHASSYFNEENIIGEYLALYEKVLLSRKS